jgi:cation diffusion facilitator CzcD-associated flavoprotein CzcO
VYQNRVHRSATSSPRRLLRFFTSDHYVMTSDGDRISIRARTVAVVGAGPSGVIVAKYLRAEKAFDKIALFEQRDRPGGIWIYTGEQRDENLFDIPQTDPNRDVQKPEWQFSEKKTNGNARINGIDPTSKTPSFLSPIYEKLETNIPRGLMGFHDLDWPSDSQLFPTHDTVLKYIEDYSADVQDFVQYCTQVTNVVPTDPNNTSSSWTVTTQNLLTNETTSEVYDAVIVANGHFIVPHIPPIPEIKEWNSRHPNRISHSKYYRRPEEFTNKKVIVVGNSASGADVSAQIANYCQQPLLWSTRSQSLFSATHGTASQDQKRREVPQITRFLPSSRGVQFEDGTQEHDIDAIVFATGYFYSLPFLQSVEPKLITTGGRVNHTYQHLFYAARPTLSFLALNQRVIPFPIAEAQAAVLARVYAGRLDLPPLATMRAWEKSVEDEMGAGRNFHLLNFPKDGNYINQMSQWALSATERDGLENGGKGKMPPIWGEWEFWCREHFPKIRQAFGARGEERRGVRSLEELGFVFEERARE